MHFSSIQPIDRDLSGATIPGQSRPRSNSNEGVLSISQHPQHHWNLTIRLFSVISRTLIGGGGGGLTLLPRSSRCILQPEPTGQDDV